MLPQLLNMLTWWQWLILAAVPPAIIALYFLKLKRRPLEVPSTYLWHKSIEDLHVNTIWQRLRRNLLLFLQLLLILLAMLAVLRPGWRGAELTGDRFIFLIDNSASMQATDCKPSRLEEAKRRAGELIERMKPGDVAMIVSFADTARVEQMFTDNRRQLHRSLEAIRPTCRRTSPVEALKVASGLANPDAGVVDTGTDPNAFSPTLGTGDDLMAEALPATLFLLSDGNFDPASDFSLGNLTPVYTPIGSARAANVGIVAFNVERNELRPSQLEAFARLENFGPEQISVAVELRLNGQMINADQLTIGPGQVEGVVFPLGAIDAGVLSLRATTGDDLLLDDEAWTVVNPPRRAKVLLVTDGNEPLEFALRTDFAKELAELTIESPDFLEKEEYRQQADVGAYDLVIYDRCAPKQMPQANTLFIGRLPQSEAGDAAEKEKQKGWAAGPKVQEAMIIDTDPTHPLMQWIDVGDVRLFDASPLEVPPGASVLIDSHVGPMLAIAPRGGFEDVVLGFVLIDEVTLPGGKPELFFGTNWPIRASFPAFVLNVLQYLGGGRTGLAAGSAQPGQPVTLENPFPDKPLEVRAPSGQYVNLTREEPGKLNFTGTSQLGVYEVRSGGNTLEHFAVNLFHGPESDIRPKTDVNIGPVQVGGQSSGWETARRELWKSLLLVALVVLCLEWYVYNRRVYM